jgi:hypothetical protein
VTEPADPATVGTWHDQAPTVATAAGNLLQLAATDARRDRLEPLARAAMGAIDQRLQLLPAAGARVAYTRGGVTVNTYLDGEQPPDVTNAAVDLTVELFRRKDAVFGVLGSASPSGEPVRVSSDHMRGVESRLQPYVERFGFA